MTIDPILPLTWIIVIAVTLPLLTVFTHLRAGRQLGKPRNVLLTALRLVSIFAIISLLLRFSEEQKITPPSAKRSFLIAVDKSASMAENDTGGITRFEEALQSLDKGGVFSDELQSIIRFHVFDSSSQQVSREALAQTIPDGDHSLTHSSLRQLFRNHQGPPPSALLIVSDGHDLESIPPGQTARLASDRKSTIYSLPIGASGSTRDISIRIASYQPYTFRKQKTRLAASIRTIACPRETLVVDLLQFEYSFQIQPVNNESLTTNNSAVSYLNVLDEKIRVLMIEGTPYWDSTFLRRSLARNDKLDIDALIRFTPTRTRAVRSNPKRANEELNAPQSIDDFLPYKVVILGKQTQEILGEKGLSAMEEWVDQKGGIVIFARGQAWENTPNSRLEPIKWTNESSPARLEIATAALSIPPFKLLHQRTTSDKLPEIRSYKAADDPKTLSESYVDTNTQNSGVVFRRLGRGQTLSLGVGDLWKWVFNKETEYDNNLYDLFWDQLLLWMLSNGGLSPSSDYSFQTNTANLATGEEITFTLNLNGLDPPQSPPTVIITHQKEQAAVLALAANDDASAYSASFTPRATGRHSATLALPNGQNARARFMVFTQDLERTETAADPVYLEQLASATGGHLVQPEDLTKLFTTLLREASPMQERTRLVPLWDKIWILLTIIFLLALEWFLRRRWGLT